MANLVEQMLTLREIVGVNPQRRQTEESLPDVYLSLPNYDLDTD